MLMWVKPLVFLPLSGKKIIFETFKNIKKNNQKFMQKKKEMQ